MSMSKRVHMWSPTFATVMLVVIQLVSSHLEGNIGEFYFIIPDVTRNFADAASWCKANNSTLAVVNDSHTQTALTHFLDSSHLTSVMYINVKLYQNHIGTWFLVDGDTYLGYIGNQAPRESNYLLYCRLRYEQTSFIVMASAPSDSGNYVCDFEENRCSSDSDNSIVYNRICYVKYENESLTWYQARERCHNSGGDLAQFQSDPNSWTPPFNTSWLNKSLTYWIGIRYNNWSWKSPESDQEYIFTSWSNGKPNNYSYGCVCVDPNGHPPWSWTDCDCTVQRQFVCLKLFPSSTITTSTITTTALMSTPRNATTSKSIMVDKDVCQLTCAQANKSEALTVGLVLGIIVILPLIIIIVILVVVVVRQRRQLREKPRSNESVNQFAKTTSVTEDRSSAEASDTHYQHLQTDSRPVTMMPLYDQLNQPEPQEYEPIS